MKLRDSLPTFLGIGAMRCGSTWLYEALRRHPEIQLSHAKELDFFFMERMLEFDFEWYAQHFIVDQEPPKAIRGEISPRYGRLKLWQVKRIAQLLPDLRIILTLRHPIERVWSQALYDFGYLAQRDLKAVTASEFLRLFERARLKLSSDYCRTIDFWTEAFSKEQLHIDLFDKLCSDPATYLARILHHIGAESRPEIPHKLIERRVYSTNSLVGTKPELPEFLKWYIAEECLEPTKRLNEKLGGRVTHWVNELLEVSRGKRMTWRIRKQVNQFLLSVPERLAYQVYDAGRDLRLWLRWRRLVRASSLLDEVAFQTN